MTEEGERLPKSTARMEKQEKVIPPVPACEPAAMPAEKPEVNRK